MTYGQISNWRNFKHQETMQRFPFMQETSWQARFPFLKPRWSQRSTLRVHDALRPFSLWREADQASEIVAVAARLNPQIGVMAIEQLLLALRYSDTRARSSAYADPEKWVRRRCRS